MSRLCLFKASEGDATMAEGCPRNGIFVAADSGDPSHCSYQTATCNEFDGDRLSAGPAHQLVLRNGTCVRSCPRTLHWICHRLWTLNAIAATAKTPTSIVAEVVPSSPMSSLTPM